jgi:hypothetical protein
VAVEAGKTRGRDLEFDGAAQAGTVYFPDAFFSHSETSLSIFFGLLFPLIVSLQKRVVHAVQRHPGPDMEARKWRGGRLRHPVITGSGKQVVLSIQTLACLPRQASSHVIPSALLRMTLFT